MAYQMSGQDLAKNKEKTQTFVGNNKKLGMAVPVQPKPQGIISKAVNGLRTAGRVARDLITGDNVLRAIDKRQNEEAEISRQRAVSRRSEY
jgi:hypothetical protein